MIFRISNCALINTLTFCQLIAQITGDQHASWETCYSSELTAHEATRSGCAADAKGTLSFSYNYSINTHTWGLPLSKPGVEKVLLMFTRKSHSSSRVLQKSTVHFCVDAWVVNYGHDVIPNRTDGSHMARDLRFLLRSVCFVCMSDNLLIWDTCSSKAAKIAQNEISLSAARQRLTQYIICYIVYAFTCVSSFTSFNAKTLEKIFFF